jgi:hypothetical protein
MNAEPSGSTDEMTIIVRSWPRLSADSRAGIERADSLAAAVTLHRAPQA